MANRFQDVIPKAVPWRERHHVDAMAAALIARDATDAEAAAVYAAECEELRGRLRKMLEMQPPAPIVIERDAAIRIAMFVEREACAKVAEEANQDGSISVHTPAAGTLCSAHTPHIIAQRIRARATEPR